MLGQDESKKLAVGKPEDKYDFYLRASGLKAVLEELKAANVYSVRETDKTSQNRQSCKASRPQRWLGSRGMVFDWLPSHSPYL